MAEQQSNAMRSSAPPRVQYGVSQGPRYLYLTVPGAAGPVVLYLSATGDLGLVEAPGGTRMDWQNER